MLEILRSYLVAASNNHASAWDFTGAEVDRKSYNDSSDASRLACKTYAITQKHSISSIQLIYCEDKGFREVLGLTIFS
jgi:hypothetical protein